MVRAENYFGCTGNSCKFAVDLYKASRRHRIERERATTTRRRSVDDSLFSSKLAQSNLRAGANVADDFRGGEAAEPAC